MQLRRIDDLHAQLKTRLLPFYLIHGDEPLLIEECADALRAACRAQGVSERLVFNVDAGFDWNRLAAEFSGMSLFGERRLIEVRLAGAKPGSAGSKALRELAGLPPADDVLLVLAGKLDRDVERSAWVKALEKAGATLRVWALRRNELPGWVTQRLRAAGFRPTRDAVALLCERVEGNLLAARQEIEKLALLAEPGLLEADTLATLVGDSARYSIFDLCERVFEGDLGASVRTLATLRAEGTEAVLVLWALAEDTRRALRVARRCANGERIEQALKAERGKPAIATALRRLGAPGLQRTLRLAADVDRCIKGLERRDAWEALLELVTTTAGVPTQAKNGNASRRALS